jgi:hypothetical protein
MKLELTIKTTYLPNWGAYEGIRELLQNGRDAVTEHGATFDVRWRMDASGLGVLVIENEGCVLPHEALLLGHTSKLGRADLIGKFGEGLKLGVLALVRAGHRVKIRSGSEVWVPRIARSDKFDADVLVFDIMTGRKTENRVQVEIGNVSAEAWEKLQEHFLFLHEIEADETVKSHSGTLLLAPRYQGMIFVKGIFVQKGEFEHGYNLADAEVDRDRKMVDRWDLSYRTNAIWREAMGARPDLIGGYVTMLDRGTADVSEISAYAATELPTEVKEAAAALFVDRYGKNAVPVTTLSESADMEHLGRVGIVVNKSLGAVLATTFGTVADQKEKLRNETVKLHGWHDLTEIEKANLRSAIELVVAASVPCTLDEIDVVDFRDAGLQGLYKDGRTQIAKKHLAHRDETLAILVHEIAHRLGGGDGEKSHVSNIERIWSGIVASMRGA